MTADPVRTEDLTEEQDGHLREMMRYVHALDTYSPAELARLLASPGLKDYARRAVEAVAALQMVRSPHLATKLAPLLALSRGDVGAQYPDIVADRIAAEVKYAGPVRKVSVSMPADLTVAVQQRVGRGKFSQYVTEAVTRHLEMDLLDELSALLTSEHGPVPEEYLAEARTAWPDDE
jgi:Arc/MetJ-type ribon-helix-helix transcriptional regulator